LTVSNAYWNTIRPFSNKIIFIIFLEQMETNDSKVAEENEILRIAKLYEGKHTHSKELTAIRRMAKEIKRKRSKEEDVVIN
jgi:hypothetical protein